MIAVLGQCAEQELEQRPREALERDRGGDRIARDADHGRAFHHAERDRMRRAQGHAVHDELPVPGQHAGRVVGAPAGGARDHEHEVGGGCGPQHGLSDLGGIVRTRRQALAERAAVARERL